MSYSNFTLDDVTEKFDLELRLDSFIPSINSIAPSNWLQETLTRTIPLARGTNSEKARSEFIIAPILTELKSLTNDTISVFSGKEFNVDRESGLTGICDFLISQNPIQLKLTSPVICIVEAKRGILEEGWGQCVAEMVATQKFNQTKGKSIEYIYGIVTSGSLWQFLQIKEKIVSLDPEEYALHPLDRLFGILNWLVRVQN
jgi:hypothetical protein